MGKIVDKNLFLVVPKIVEQPTWGGDYILESKNWHEKPPFKGLKIGQSYELYSGSKLRSDLISSADRDFTGEFSRAKSSKKTEYGGRRHRLISLSGLIGTNPVAVLGPAAAKKGKGKLDLLIKFTQASGNSFQIHVKPGVRSKRWKPKPESWYYFRPGLVTLGLKPGTKIGEFRRAVKELDEKLRELSAAVKSGRLGLGGAQNTRNRLIERYDPWQYVNRLVVGKDEVIDLSDGGLHHSWEDDAKRFPLGNLVYEIQLDVMDPISTLRCFDKGKFKLDGSLRELDIDDFFRFLDSRPSYNRPERHRSTPIKIHNSRMLTVESLIRNRRYRLERLILKSAYTGPFTSTGRSFHHLFIKEGAAKIVCGPEELLLTRGHSCFVCARAGSYRLEPVKQGKKKVEILKTFII